MKRLGLGTLAAMAGAPLLSGCVVATSSRDGGSGSSFFLLLLPMAVVVLMAGLARRGLRSSGRRQAFAGPQGESTNEHVLRAELSVLADDVIRLEAQVALNEQARDDYEAATHRYRVAQAAMDHAKEPVDLVRVQRVVDEANWAMSRARAILAGRTPPEPPPPLQRPGPHGEPAIGVDEGHHPIYLDSPAPFRSGWFSAGGGLFGGLLLGTMLGGFGGAWVSEDDVAGGADIDPEATDW